MARTKKNISLDELFTQAKDLLNKIQASRKSGDYETANELGNKLFNTGRNIMTKVEQESKMASVPFLNLAVNSVLQVGEDYFVKVEQPTRVEDAVFFKMVFPFANQIAIYNPESKGMDSERFHAIAPEPKVLGVAKTLATVK